MRALVRAEERHRRIELNADSEVVPLDERPCRASSSSPTRKSPAARRVTVEKQRR
jgi:hypothetical protein